MPKKNINGVGSALGTNVEVYYFYHPTATYLCVPCVLAIVVDNLKGTELVDPRMIQNCFLSLPDEVLGTYSKRTLEWIFSENGGGVTLRAAAEVLRSFGFRIKLLEVFEDNPDGMHTMKSFWFYAESLMEDGDAMVLSVWIVERDNHSNTSPHAVCILKLDGLYVFLDPSDGVACKVYSNLRELIRQEGDKFILGGYEHFGQAGIMEAIFVDGGD